MRGLIRHVVPVAGAAMVLLAGAAGSLAYAPSASAAANPTLSTTPHPAKVTLGPTSRTLKDSADLSGGSSPTGSLIFTLFLDGNLQDSETVTVSGNGTYTTPVGFTTSTAGTYQWDATYNGDGNNNPVSDTNNPDEQVVVSPAKPVLTTTPHPARVTLGKTPPTLKDSAVLSGGSSPTGSITFTLFLGTTQLDTEFVTVSGNGTYTTPTGFTTSTVGTYQWDATYSGDANNKAVSDTNNPREQVVVSKSSPAPTWRVVLSQHVGPPTNFTGLDAITATGKKDAWAFGASDVATFTGPIAYRWQGVRWRASTLPRGLGSAIGDASEPAANDVWAVSPDGYVLHFDGSRWRLVKRFGGNGAFSDIVAFSRTNVWVFGGPASGPGRGTYHFNGRSWAKVTAATRLGILTVSALSSRNMWATGTHTRLVDSIYHYTGTWRRVTASALRGLTFFNILALGKNNVWAVAESDTRNVVSYLLHFNGKRWARFKPPWPIFFGGMAPDGRGGLWFTAADNSPASWAVHRTASGRWQRILIAKSSAGMDNLANIPGTSSLWAVGSLAHGPGTSAIIWAHGKVG